MCSKNGRVEKMVEAHYGALLSMKWNYDGSALATGIFLLYYKNNKKNKKKKKKFFFSFHNKINQYLGLLINYWMKLSNNVQNVNLLYFFFDI